MVYKSIQVTGRGGLEFVEVVEKPLRSPTAGEARIKIMATPVVQDDVAVRIGNRPVLPKLPFTPGYSFIGIVEAVGDGVTNVHLGDCVTALTNFNSHAEYIYWPADQLAPVPATLNPIETAVIILNYLVAYQILHRVAQVKSGDKVFIIGASGGVGTAFLQLGQIAGLTMYGSASASKHHILKQYGAIPIDYRSQDFVQLLKQAEPDGIDFVFNGMDETFFKPGIKVLGRGGVLVHYGGPLSFTHLLLLVAKLGYYNLLPNGKKIKGYGTHRLGVDLFQKDWATLFNLLEERQIEPVIYQVYPILEAAKAYACLESGQVFGNIVLVSPEHLSTSE